MFILILSLQTLLLHWYFSQITMAAIFVFILLLILRCRWRYWKSTRHHSQHRKIPTYWICALKSPVNRNSRSKHLRNHQTCSDLKQKWVVGTAKLGYVNSLVYTLPRCEYSNVVKVYISSKIGKQSLSKYKSVPLPYMSFYKDLFKHPVQNTKCNSNIILNEGLLFLLWITCWFCVTPKSNYRNKLLGWLKIAFKMDVTYISSCPLLPLFNRILNCALINSKFLYLFLKLLSTVSQERALLVIDHSCALL